VRPASPIVESCAKYWVSQFGQVRIMAWSFAQFSEIVDWTAADLKGS
jgi:hypothetical protein